MKDLMDTCVNSVMELIKAQIVKVSYGKNQRVRVRYSNANLYKSSLLKVTECIPRGRLRSITLLTGRVARESHLEKNGNASI